LESPYGGSFLRPTPAGVHLLSVGSNIPVGWVA
jgi:hypothetical protein